MDTLQVITKKNSIINVSKEITMKQCESTRVEISLIQRFKDAKDYINSTQAPSATFSKQIYIHKYKHT